MMNNRGFTLIEVLISIILMAIILVGGMAFYTSASTLATLASHKKHATYIANAYMEAIKRKDYADLNALSDGTARDCATVGTALGFTIGTLVGDLPTSTCNITINNEGSPTYRRIELALNWNEASGNSPTVQFTSFIAP